MRTKLLLLRSIVQRPNSPFSKGPGPHTHGALPTEYHEGHGRMPSPDPQSTCGLVGQTPINPLAPCGGYRAGPLFHDQDENRIVPPESEVVDYRPNSPLQYPGVRPSREAEKCDPSVVGTHSPVPLFKKEGPPPQFATPEVLSPTSMQCCRGVSAKTAPQHPEI
ncbi:hypothetical protein L3Q82_004222 [Scortum barcoo]|uniref:Uncharacterized protein n=1 Tax=Scortum barcoo TaxID=214431 RepID=A0ACB8VKM6_9TELE|nr:hypothetical protein L3Q82_004222 [Scortum barcoo]